MRYTTKEGPDAENAARDLAVHMSHPGPENWKALGRLIGYLKCKNTKGIIIRKPKVMILVIFCDSNYVIDNETRNILSGLVATLGGTLITCLSKTQRNVTLSSTEAEYVTLSSFAQKINFVSMFLVEMNEVQNPSVIYEDNQGAIFLANNRQVGIRTKHIDIRRHFLQDMVEEKDICVQYIRSEYNPAGIMTNNNSEAGFASRMKRIT